MKKFVFSSYPPLPVLLEFSVTALTQHSRLCHSALTRTSLLRHFPTLLPFSQCSILTLQSLECHGCVTLLSLHAQRTSPLLSHFVSLLSHSTSNLTQFSLPVTRLSLLSHSDLTPLYVPPTPHHACSCCLNPPTTHPDYLLYVRTLHRPQRQDGCDEDGAS